MKTMTILCFLHHRKIESSETRRAWRARRGALAIEPLAEATGLAPILGLHLQGFRFENFMVFGIVL